MRAERAWQSKLRMLVLLVPVLVLAHALAAGAQPAGAGAGAVAPTVVDDPALESEVMELSHKLRCLVCQNQSIAESNAPLAVDLRNQVREQLAAGRSQRDVLSYLVDRYGDFVLYEPPLKASTVLLWAGPAILLLGGIGWMVHRLRRRLHEAAALGALSEAERRRAAELLDGQPAPRSAQPSSAPPESRN